MKIVVRIFLLLAIAVSITFLPSALSAFYSITEDPAGWQGGVSEISTLVWFAIIVLGYGFLALQTFLALMGIFFGFGNRIAAFWLLLFPGMFGIILGLVWLVLLMLFDAEWPNSWMVAAILLVPPFVAWLSGRFVRKKIKRKNKRAVAESVNV